MAEKIKFPCIQVAEGEINQRVITCGDPAIAELISKFFDDPVCMAKNREFWTFNGTYKGVPVSVTSHGVGCGGAAIAFESMWRAGAKVIIRVGTCGGIEENVLGGDLVIATGAIRMEGTGLQYAPVEFPAVADFQVVNALAEAAKADGQRFHTGVVHCKDSFYGQLDPDSMPVRGELKSKWQAWLDCGALASEMESAALFVVAAARRVRVGTVLLVLGNQTRRAKGLEDIQCHDTEQAVRVAADAMRRLIKRDKTS